MRLMDHMRRPRQRRRRGITLPVIAVSLIGIFGFVALGVDVGRMNLARSQCQGAADVAAMAGARSLNGIYPQDVDGASANAISAASRFTILGTALTSTNVAVTHGTYRYDTSGRQFVPSLTLQAGENYNLTQVTVNFACPTTFARAFGFNTFNVTSKATAAHRPRDVAIVLDYSGSMNNESDLWNNEGYLDNNTAAPNNPNNTSNNAETVYPKFGHYSNETNYSNYTNYANLLCPSASSGNALTGNAAIGRCNVSVTALGIPAMVNDFWRNARGAATASAFTAVADATLETVTNWATGDKFLRNNNNTANPFASTISGVNGGTTTNVGFETTGYKQFTGVALIDYTQGPRYWGKTFFIWPPDPTNDWRSKYFGTADNTKLWDATGNWRNPSGYYTINYKAILAWIKTAPNPFPTVLRSGNTLFYDQIPTDVPASAYTHTNSNGAITDQNQRFWKEYIDYVCGVWRDPNGNVQAPQSPSCSYGPDYTFGTIKVSVPPGGGKYMDYADNPERPRHRLWFGPMTMIQYMSDTGILPGTTHDISMYPMKTGIGGALQDIQANHPNDLVSMILFSRPQFNNDADGTGAFNLAQDSLTNNYQSLINGCGFPPTAARATSAPGTPTASRPPAPTPTTTPTPPRATASCSPTTSSAAARPSGPSRTAARRASAASAGSAPRGS
jgi:Putative Flp pilus-assembly TadE/G-like